MRLGLQILNLILLSGSEGEAGVPRLVEHPADVVVARDEPATLRCEAAGQPEPEIRWIKDGVEVRTAPSDPASHRVLLPSGALFFLKAVQNKKEDDRGTYWCVATNNDGEAVSRKAQLDIATLKSSFSEEPLDTWVVAGEDVKLPCEPPVGHPVPEIEWRKNGDKIVSSERMVVSENNLIISSAQQSDEGRYQCIARNIAGVRHSTQALLSVYVPPFVIKAPENASVDAGTEAKFSCVMGGDPSPQIKWIREGGKVSYVSAAEDDAAVLRIKNVSEAESGKYVCQAENIAGDSSVSAFLSITIPPVFSITPVDKNVKLGETVLMQCKVDTRTGQNVRMFWQKDGVSTTLMPGSKHNHISVDLAGNLRIDGVTSEDEGWFGCFAVSVTGSSSALARLSLKSNPLQPPPIIQLGPVNQTVSEGNLLTLHCQFSARDKARVAWLKEGIPIEFSDNDRYYLTDGYNLQIKDSKLQDSGLYTCLIKTSSGQSSASASINVLKKEATEDNLTAVTDMLAFPASPSKPKLISSGEDYLSIIWGKPHRVGASPLRGYQVEYFAVGTGNHWVTSQVQEEQFTLEDISPETSAVMFLVRARNEHGLSPPSPLSDTIFTESGEGNLQLATGKLRKKSEVLKQISDKLVELEEVAILGSKKVRLSWKVIAKTPNIQSFHIELAEVGGSSETVDNLNTITISGSGTKSHVLTNLKPNTEYSVFIIPYSDNLLSRPASLRYFKTKTDVPDVAPSNVKLQLVNVSSALVTWVSPRVEHLHGDLTGFKVEIFTNNTLVTNFTLEPSAQSLILNNITTDVIYSVRLAAFNRAGMGPFSQRVSLAVEPRLVHHQSVLIPDHTSGDLTIPNVDTVLQQTWFVSTVGVLAIFLILAMAGFVYVKRKFGKDKSVDHYDVPVCKSSDESSGGGSVNYLESDTVWINPNKSVSGSGVPHNLSYQDKTSHLYINKICPPEYSELDGRSSYRNINHCTPSSQGQYYASTNIMDKVHSFTPSNSLPCPSGNATGSDLSCSSDQSGSGHVPGHKMPTGDTSSCSSRHSESYKLSGSRSDSGSQGSGGGNGNKIPYHVAEDHVHHRIMSSNARVTDPGLPPPVPPMRGPSSYNAGARSFNSFGVGGYCGDSIYNYQYGPKSPYIYAPPSANHYETASIYQEHCLPRYEPSQESGAKCRKDRPKKPRKLKRRMSDVGKANDNIPQKNKISQSVTSSPALSRKSSKTNIKTSEELGPGKTKTSLSNLVYDCDKSFQVANDSSRVSEDINDMVEQIQAIQNDISELAGRPISLIDYKQ